MHRPHNEPRRTRFFRRTQRPRQSVLPFGFLLASNVPMSNTSLLATPKPVCVLKFGGTSVGTAARLRRVVQVVQRSTTSHKPIVVVSAASGVTDVLRQAVDKVDADDTAARTIQTWIEYVGHRYRALAASVLDDPVLCDRYEKVLQVHTSELRRLLAPSTSDPNSAVARNAVLAIGERLMAPLLVGSLKSFGSPTRVVDATRLICTDGGHGQTSVEWISTHRCVQEWAHSWPANVVPVTTGFLGEAPDGTTTTLGRGGSDYSAAILARILHADRLERWTDVDALYTCDPRRNDNAQRLETMSFKQARNWTKRGRLGLHPKMFDPLEGTAIDVYIRGIRAVNTEGTHIQPCSSTTRVEH